MEVDRRSCWAAHAQIRARTIEAIYTLGWFVSQAKLESVLRQELLTLGCAIESGRRLTSLTRHEGFIHANICGENKDYVPEKVGVSFLIGADGAKGKDCTLRRYISLFPFRSNTNGNWIDFECSPI